MKGIAYIPLVILIFAVIIGGILLLGVAVPEIGLLFQVFLAFVIFSFVSRMLGQGLLTYIISAILIYILVIRFYYLFAAGYIFYLIVATSIGSIILFGLQKH